MSDLPIHVYCADIGSSLTNNEENHFGWAGRPAVTPHTNPESCTCQYISHLVDHVSASLKDGNKVALGFECPLWVPIHDDPNDRSVEPT